MKNMGFEAYTVHLVPCSYSPLATGQQTDAIQRIVNDLRQKWPVLRSDETELRSLVCPLVPGEACLVYQTAQGLIQIMLTPCRGQASVSLRFAYCNPRSVYQPFTAMIAWLMERHQMHGYVMASDKLPDLSNPQEVETVLVPSMDYNRRLWQQDAGTSEEAILRPGEAIERFISVENLSPVLV
jgi:hypothetical protein